MHRIDRINLSGYDTNELSVTRKCLASTRNTIFCHCQIITRSIAVSKGKLTLKLARKIDGFSYEFEERLDIIVFTR